MKIQHGGNVSEIREKYAIEHEIKDFSANINPLGIPRSIQVSLVTAMDYLQDYPDMRYHKLKKAIASHHALKDENWVYPANGAAEAIFNLAQAISIKKMALLAPTFMEYEGAYRHTGTKFCYYPTEADGFQVKMEKLIYFLGKNKCDGFCLCNPNNPTGNVLSRKELQPLLAYCRENQIKLIVDEAFIDFTDQQQNTLVDALEAYPQLYILRSMTKMFAIPGLRLGYLLTSDQEVMRVLNAQAVPWHINTFADQAGQAAIQDQSFVSKTNAYITKERCRLFEGLNQFRAHLKVFPSETNYLFFLFLGGCDLQQALLKKGFLIRDCRSFRGLTNNYYRIAVKDQETNQQFLSALREVLWEKEQPDLSALAGN